jgi:endonuclease/exonuclease/phosphatase family metal-dependent hydrolase
VARFPQSSPAMPGQAEPPTSEAVPRPIRPVGGWRALARRAARSLGVLLAIFIGYRVVFVYRFAPSSCPEPTLATHPMPTEASRSSTQREIVVATYNIAGHNALRRGGYLKQVAEALRSLNVDAVGLQEVHRGTWQARFADQATELAELTGLSAHLGPSFSVWGGAFGNAVLTRGEIVGAEVLPLPRMGEPRSALHARLSIDGQPLDLYVTHLTAWGEINRWIRTRQAACLCDAFAAAPATAVLMGDLNAPPGAPELARLRELGLATDVEPTHAWTGRALDAIVAGRGWEVVSRQVVRIGPSDHWPVVARLRWVGDRSAIAVPEKPES